MLDLQVICVSDENALQKILKRKKINVLINQKVILLSLQKLF
jgi:hypothetical protein